MARPLRIEFSGALYHVTSRGDGREDIFLAPADQRMFLEVLAGVQERYNWTVHAYCLMTNHYHLVVETRAGICNTELEKGSDPFSLINEFKDRPTSAQARRFGAAFASLKRKNNNRGQTTILFPN